MAGKTEKQDHGRVCGDKAGAKALYPVFLDLSQKSVLLVGDAPGPEEGARLLTPFIDMLLPCAGHLTVLVPEAGSALRELASGEALELVEAEYSRSYLQGMDLVLSVSRDAALNDDLHALCRTLGIRVFIEGQGDRCDFLIVPPQKPGDKKKAKKKNLAPAPKPAPGTVSIYTDGAARGNPGPGGYGAVLSFTDKNGQLHQKELSQGYIETTNNRMELMGAIAALEALSRPCRIEFWSDSQYLVKAFTDHWIDKWARKNWMFTRNKPVKNADLWKRLVSAAQPHSITWNWVQGHPRSRIR